MENFIGSCLFRVVIKVALKFSKFYSLIYSSDRCNFYHVKLVVNNAIERKKINFVIKSGPFY